MSSTAIIKGRTARDAPERPGSADPARRALQPVVDGLAQARVRDRGYFDQRGVGPIGGAQEGEQIGGGLGQVSGRAEVQVRGAARWLRAEGEPGGVRAGLQDIQP